MTSSNRIVVAAAGSGKTTFLVDEAVKITEERVLITTYTESNEAEIRQRFFDKFGHVPANITIMTWFKFLINHGVKPFQGGMFDFSVRGMQLVSGASGVRYRTREGVAVKWPECNVRKHFFDDASRVFSDKLSKLVIRCDAKSNGAVIDRISRIYRNIFVDEVQDLAGYDLDILMAFARSPVRLLMVGDPRQVTYLTHHERRFSKYSDGGIVDFLRNELPKKVKIDIDDATLNQSHRNNAAICSVSSRLFPELAATKPCDCEQCRSGEPTWAGAFIVQPADYVQYLNLVGPMQLRDKSTSSGVDDRLPAMNFGQSKGRGFDHVVIVPTKPMKQWLVDPTTCLRPQSRAKFYVALTRARHSIGVVMDWSGADMPEGFAPFRSGRLA